MRRLISLAVATAVLGAGGVRPAASAQEEGGKGPHGNPEAVFKRIDTNGDGKLSKEEFRAFIEKVSKGKRKIGVEQIDRLFSLLDTDGDGYLSLEEFKKLRDLREKIAERRKAKKEAEKAGQD